MRWYENKLIFPLKSNVCYSPGLVPLYTTEPAGVFPSNEKSSSSHHYVGGKNS